MDHFFDQDLRALEAHPRLYVRRFPYQRLRNPALRMMGTAAAGGLSEFTRPELEPSRRRYASWLRAEVRRMYLERAFDIVVLPSDTFFYVRSLPDAAHALGVPVVVVQKETTISIDTMEAHSKEQREHAPFLSDFMTVCSHRHREFWLRAGADGTLVDVTGQPRFDIYAARHARPSSPRRRVLFLTYELDAYVPGVAQWSGGRTWAPLRDATEEVLFGAVRSGTCEVIVKCHPQQDHRAEEERLARRAGPAWNRGLSLAALDADTRDLILASDVVVGFQTTALYEAVAARKSVVFAAWGPAYDQFRAGLIPFHEAPPQCLRFAASTDQLAALLSDQLESASAHCASWYEEALGPVDGHATERVAARLEAVAASWPPTPERRGLELRRRRYAVGLLLRSLAAETVWTLGIPAARLSGQERRVAVRRNRARQASAMAVATLRDAPDRNR